MFNRRTLLKVALGAPLGAFVDKNRVVAESETILPTEGNPLEQPETADIDLNKMAVWYGGDGTRFTIEELPKTRASRDFRFVAYHPKILNSNGRAKPFHTGFEYTDQEIAERNLRAVDIWLDVIKRAETSAIPDYYKGGVATI